MAKVISFPGSAKPAERQPVRVLACAGCSNLTFICVLDDETETSNLECAFCSLVVGEDPEQEDTLN